MKNNVLIGGLVLCFCFFSCSDSKGGADEPAPTPVTPEEIKFELSESESRAAEQIEGFYLDYFRAVNAASPENENLVVSPLSAGVLLSMLSNAASDELSAQITDALGCTDLDAVNSLSAKYLACLPGMDKHVNLAMANSLWYKREYTLADNFAKAMVDVYKSDAVPADIATTQTKDAINAWANEKTNGLIPWILQNTLPANCVAVIADALYFKGAWANPFDKKDSDLAKFTGLSATREVPMMHKEGMQHVCLSLDRSYRSLRLDFGNGAFAAHFVLPNEMSVDEFIASPDCARALSESYFDENVILSLPAFKLAPEQPVSLNSALAALGMTSLGSYLPAKMFTQQVEAAYNVFQKSSLEFNEEGAEGASVTWTQMATSPDPDAAPAETPVLSFDRPFVFVITEAKTGACLFAGKIVNL